MSKEEQLALKKAEYEGGVFKTNNYGDVVVLEYKNARDITIKFLNTGNIRKTATSELKKGEIRDNEAFPVYKVGVMDIPNELRRGQPHPREYSIWNGVRQRCYNENIRHLTPSYQEVEMSENFKRYSYFKEWCNKQIGFDQVGWQLDKDILFKGNKVYSEDTCCFVPPEINILFTKANRIRGKYPIGIYEDKQAGKFKVRISVNGKQKHIGRYYCEKEAFNAYKQAKEAYIKELANKWKDQIDVRVYEALMCYEVDIDD